MMNSDISEMEGRIPRDYGQDADEIPGSRSLLKQLDDAVVPWAVVTSGTRALITGWLERLKLAVPKVLVVAEDVSNGKPDPEGYLMGKRKLGLGEGREEFVVLEDAPSGIRAGKAAGCKVIALATTHEVGQLREAGADWIVRDMRSVVFKGVDEGGRVTLAICDGLVQS